MIKLQVAPSTVVGTSVQTVYLESIRQNWIFVGTPMYEDLKFQYLVQGARFEPENWNECYNYQSSGTIDLSADPNVNRPTDNIDQSKTYSDLGLISGNTWLFPVGTGTTYTFRRAKGIVYTVIVYVDSWMHDEKVYYRFCEAAYRHYTPSGQPDYWLMASGQSHGFMGPLPARLESRNPIRQFTSIVSHYEVANGQVSSAGRPIYPYSMSMKPNPISKELILSILRQNRSSFIASIHSDQANKTPELHAQSFDGVEKFDGNLLAYFSDIKSRGSSTLDSFSRLLQPEKLTKKEAASLWLSNRYGDRLTYSDTKDLISALGLDPSRWRTKSSRFVISKGRLESSINDGFFTCPTYHACELALKPKDITSVDAAIRRAYEWDYYPSLGNVWDMIPLSFVVDWFLNVQDIYESIDRMVQARYYDTVCILQSVKAEASDPILKGVFHKYYERRFENTLSLSVDSVQLGLPSALNVIDGLALYASR